MDIDDGGIDMASGKTVAIDGTDISALSLIDEDDFASFFEENKEVAQIN